MVKRKDFKETHTIKQLRESGHNNTRDLTDVEFEEQF